MTQYARPAIPDTVYRDEGGEPIDYGHRWGEESPSQDAYSRTSNLERFAPLHTVAEALIGWASRTFDIVVERDLDVAADRGKCVAGCESHS
ncbi:DUF6226 family protein [Microbacterium terricola]|uniref:Uncharacterized protein n=1 Tax=Microbacterium terricola TaxID=344163 RepID=A0ABM8DVC4_9MICO|nr:DUF6226 family protein [Microbacterium terricola]UYK39869.1 DUF6226 family protein [Microbacterium terricola]BDV29376.1 hypothetical protein Microterr_00360 [Microbacterium terricola]